ncbi:MAG: acid phosphatase, partial [Caulobacter sp.]
MLHLLFAAAVASAACPSSDDACVRAGLEQSLKLNDLTAVGTHNSYKQSLPAGDLAAMVETAGQRALGIDYGHRP